MLPKKLKSPLLNPDINYKIKFLKSNERGDDIDDNKKNERRCRFQNINKDLSYEDKIIFTVDGKPINMRVKFAILKHPQLVYETLSAPDSVYKVNRTVYKNLLIPELKKQFPAFYEAEVKRINKRKAERNIRKKLKENPNYKPNTVNYTIK